MVLPLRWSDEPATAPVFEAGSDPGSFFGPWFGDAFRGLGAWSGAYARTLPMEVVEDGEALRIQVEVPGIRPEEIDLTVENGVLTIFAEKPAPESANGTRTLFAERSFGRFTRSVVLPSTVDVDAVEADCSDGILSVVLPKAEAARPRRIPVAEGKGLRKMLKK